jgi:hypothetical protein
MRVPNQGWFDGNPGRDFPLKPGNVDWDWPFKDIAIPIEWAPGVYIAMFSEASDENGTGRTGPDATTSDGRDSKALFVVRSAFPGRPILYKLAVFTYHAYNETERGGLYTGVTDSKASIRRPGGGTGGTVSFGATDPASPIGSQTFAHWDAPFVNWLETNGFKDLVDYCTDLEAHEDGALLSRYRLLLCVGHDEYWTPEIRTALTQFRDTGGNIAIFSGNTCFRPINFSPTDFAIERFGRQTLGLRRDGGTAGSGVRRRGLPRWIRVRRRSVPRQRGRRPGRHG